MRGPLAASLLVALLLLSGCGAPTASRACSEGDAHPACQPTTTPPASKQAGVDLACAPAAAPSDSAAVRAFFRQDAADAAADFAQALGFAVTGTQRGPEPDGPGRSWQIWYANRTDNASQGYVTVFWSDHVLALRIQGPSFEEEKATAAQAVARLVGPADVRGLPPDQEGRVFLVQATPIGDMTLGTASQFGVEVETTYDLEADRVLGAGEALAAAQGYLACAEPDWSEATLEATAPAVVGSSLAFRFQFVQPCADRVVTVDAVSGAILTAGPGGLWCG